MSRANSTTSRARRIQIGQKFNRWTVIGGLVERPAVKRPDLILVFYLCRCECGTEREVDGGNLAAGLSRSCGCLQREKVRITRRKHGQNHSRLHVAWCGIRARCGCPGVRGYKDYGGRGIKVCDEWMEAFENFRDWALANGYRDDLTIERVNVNGDYEPGNCTWIPRSAQSLNKRNTRYLTAFGETKPMGLWVRDPRCAVSQGRLSGRIQKGWNHEAAIATPPRPPGHRRNRKLG